MSKTSLERNHNGEVIGIRETSDDGRRSDLYEAVQGMTGWIKTGHLEIADHFPDGTTKAYEVIKDNIFRHQRGKQK